MSAASTANASALFDLKSASLSLEAFLLKTGNIQALGQAMAERFGDTPDFFNNDPVVIDLTHLASLDATVNFEALIALLSSFKLKPVAVRGGTVKQTAAAQEAGLSEAPDSHSAPARVETVVQEVIKEVVREVPVEVRVEVPSSVPTMVIDKPLRSGQQIYAKGGDLVVLATVNVGAELIADGSIHVYAPMRGRALAGARGNTQARIFVKAMEAELVSIAGVYRTIEQALPDSIQGKPTQIYLENERLVMTALGE